MPIDLHTQLQPHASQMAALLKAMAHKERLLILCALAEGEASVGELLQRSHLSQSAFSQHLAVLRREQIVRARKQAQHVFYAIENPVVVQLLQVLKQSACGPAAEHADRKDSTGRTD